MINTNIAIDARSLEEEKTGVARYLSNILNYFKNYKKHRFILYFKDNIPKQSNFFMSDNFTLKILKNPFRFSSNFFFQHFLLPYNLKKDKIDFLFSPFYLKPFYCPVKSAVVVHDVSYEAHPEWFDVKSQFLLKFFSMLSVKSANCVFTVSNFSKSEIIKFYKIDQSKITVTHLAADTEFANFKMDYEAENKVRKKYFLHNKFILCVGSIFNRRRIPEIIDAFEKISHKYKDFQLLIIGKNCTYPYIDIDKKIIKVNINIGRNAVVRLDFALEEELKLLYNMCEFVIYLSEYEGFGLPVIEAQSFGKAVVTSRNSSLIEIGDDSVEFVVKNTPEKIRHSIEAMISKKEYKNKLIELGKKNVARFSWEKCANDTMNILLKTIRNF